MVWLVGDGDMDVRQIEFNLYPAVRAESPCVTCDAPSKELADADAIHIFATDTLCCILVVVRKIRLSVQIVLGWVLYMRTELGSI